MITIALKPFFHKGNEQIGLCFKNDAVLNLIVKRIKGVRWSQSNKCWYLPLCKENYLLVADTTKDHAILDAVELTTYLEKRKKIIAVKTAAAETPAIAPLNIQTYNISDDNFSQLIRFVEAMQLAGNPETTIKTYKNDFMQLLKLLDKRPVETLTSEELQCISRK